MKEYEKRLHVVALNLARRHLTDAQKTLLARLVEPDVEEAARQRRLATQNNNAARVLSRVGQVSHTEVEGRTRDVVATTVGLGSGRTYERN